MPRLLHYMCAVLCCMCSVRRRTSVCIFWNLVNANDITDTQRHPSTTDQGHLSAHTHTHARVFAWVCVCVCVGNVYSYKYFSKDYTPIQYALPLSTIFSVSAAMRLLLLFDDGNCKSIYSNCKRGWKMETRRNYKTERQTHTRTQFDNQK